MIDFYVIYKPGDAASEEYLRECQLSASYYGINTIPVSGVYDRIPERLAEEALFLQTHRPTVIDDQSKQGCFLSKYYMWQKCVELNRPIGILEHDAVFVRPLPEHVLEIFDDYLNLDIQRHYYDEKVDGYFESVLTPAEFEVRDFLYHGKCRKPEYIASLKYIFRSTIRGAHAVIIKPHAAQELIDAAKKDGILTADLMPSLRYIKLQYTVPTLACINPRMWATRFEQSHTLNSRVDNK
jgi:GR25 family glycosyltransferase involved in LPS biosynthesis